MVAPLAPCHALQQTDESLSLGSAVDGVVFDPFFCGCALAVERFGLDRVPARAFPLFPVDRLLCKRSLTYVTEDKLESNVPMERRRGRVLSSIDA